MTRTSPPRPRHTCVGQSNWFTPQREELPTVRLHLPLLGDADERVIQEVGLATRVVPSAAPVVFFVAFLEAPVPSSWPSKQPSCPSRRAWAGTTRPWWPLAFATNEAPPAAHFSLSVTLNCLNNRCDESAAAWPATTRAALLPAAGGGGRGVPRLGDVRSSLLGVT